MNENNLLYDEASQAILCLFEDLSVPIEDAYANLQSLRDEIDSLMESLKLDLP